MPMTPEEHLEIGNIVREKLAEMAPLITQIMGIFAQRDTPLLDGGWVFLFMASVAFAESYHKKGHSPSREELETLFTTFEHMLTFSYGQAVVGGT